MPKHPECETEDGYRICMACRHWTVRLTCSSCPMRDTPDDAECSDTDCYYCELGFDKDNSQQTKQAMDHKS